VFPHLRYFDEDEFNHPGKMDPEFLWWVDEVRHISRVAMFPTSDWRSPSHNSAVGGSPHSQHVVRPCACMDFSTIYSQKRDYRHHKRERWLLTEAMVIVPIPDDRQPQLEWVQGPTDWHGHIALYPLGDPRMGNLTFALD